MLIDTLCRRVRHAILLLATIALAGPAWAQTGALTLPRNLNQLTDRAAVILRGNVISAQVEKHPELGSLDTVVVRLQVKETLKGEAGKTYTFRQYLWDFRDRQNAGGYAKGQDLLLLMIAPSRYGLSSPAGMSQGLFRIERDRSGREVAVNGQGNFRLFDGLSAQTAKDGIALSPREASLLAKHHKGPIELRDLTALIRAFAKESD